MTRARAAAKATEPAVRNTKIVTAAAKAKSTAPTTTKNTAGKRKTRSDDNEEDLEPQDKPSPPKRATRGRPRKAVQEEEPAAIKTTRGARVTKTLTAQPSTTEEAPAPAKATRGRPRKTVHTTTTEAATQSKTSRTRANVATKADQPAASQRTTKKVVKFEEPGKENVEPVSKKEPAPSGLRGRPAKKGVTAAAKTSSNKSAPGDKKPLSPKKVTQVSVSRDYESEDELAADGCQPTIRALQRSPVKPPSKAVPTMKSDDPLDDGIDPDSTMQVNDAILNALDLGTTSLASPARRPASSPFKDTMKSPARKIGAVSFGGSVLNSTQKPSDSQMQSPFKSSLLQSAAKRPPSPIKSLQMGAAHKPEQQLSAFKSSLLQSPAKRAVPGMKLFVESCSKGTAEGISMSSVVKSTAQALQPNERRRPSEKLLLDEDLAGDLNDDDDDEVFKKPMTNIQFPGRLSAVLPREVDPDDDSSVFDEQSEAGDTAVVTGEEEEMNAAHEHVDTPSLRADNGEHIEQQLIQNCSPTHAKASVDPNTEKSIVVDEIVVQTAGSKDEEEIKEASPYQVPVQSDNPLFQLREKDLDPCQGIDSDDEDDATLHSRGTPTLSSLAIQQNSRRSTLGFTTLADQFGAWPAASPMKTPGISMTETADLPKESSGLPSGTPPPNVNFFEDEMHVHHDGGEQSKAEDTVSQAHSAKVVEDPIFDDVMVVDEDIALAQEAEDMSLLGPKQDLSQEDSLSDASQEYGDENQMPVDPALDLENTAPVTPVRPARHNFNTTTKVPLKPADESTPSPLKKRSFSASRVAPRRPTVALSRNATVISHSPTKDSRRTTRRSSSSSTPATPRPADTTRADIWSTMGTPARTPRKDLDPALLRGAVVHVDVHTTEGADASGIFVELLNQMGARCVKTWHWNPNGATNDEPTSNKIGITHVVYKDGGKRTLEKVRQSNGVVHCVGVSWVLDCERENEWMDEAPYYIDTSLVPRGGARRRKSMEPKALANMNGTLVNNAGKGDNSNNMTRGDGQSMPNTPMNRRESAMWMRTPSDQGENEDDDDIEWSKFILTPVPKTPAPEAVSRYAAELIETPIGSNGYCDESPTKQTHITQTCPPKATSRRFMGDGVLQADKDEQVLMRLMAARRKSLQFAPKIASPLSKTWN